MIRTLPESRGNILVLEATGKLTDQDYKEILIPRLETLIGEYGTARLLIYMGDDFEGWEAAALWDDTRFGLAHRNDFEKMAVCGGPKWVEWAMKIADLLMSGEVRSFPQDERIQALQWVTGD